MIEKTFSVNGEAPATIKQIIKANEPDADVAGATDAFLDIIYYINNLEVGSTLEAGGASGSVVTRIS